MRVPTACLLLIGTLLLPARANARDAQAPPAERPQITGVRVGFAGRYKVGLWTPVEVTLRGGSQPASGELSVTVPDGDGVPSRVATPPERPCRVLPGRDTRVLLYARFGRIDSKLSVQFQQADSQQAGGRTVTRSLSTSDTADRTRFLPAVAAGRRLIVGVGAGPLGLEDAIGLQRQPLEQRTVVARLDDAAELPQQWHGYEGVDTLVLSTSRPEIYSSLTPGCPRIEALDQWVRVGGKLVVCVGSRAGEFLGDEGLLAPLARFLPGRLAAETLGAAEKVSIFPLRQTGALETYSASPIPIPSRSAGKVPQVPKLTEVAVDGIIEAQETDLPLVVRTPRGFGQIVFFAGDLDRQPLKGWEGGRPKLLAKLLALPTARAGESDDGDRHFDDLAGQLRSALDQFSKVRLIPFWAVVALIVVYILLIGPGDYFFLRKLNCRMQWTWLTFPLIVITFSVGAYLAARRLKGDRICINQLDLVDVDTQSGLVRGTSWMNIFSPQAKSFDLSLRPGLPDGTVPSDAEVTLSWLGLPGRFLGGMNPQLSNPAFRAEAYDFSPKLDAMRHLPIQIWSTKSLTARWTAHTRGGPTAELAEDGRSLLGTVTNTLDFPLSNCFLIYGHDAYTLETRDKLGTLQPGESTVLDALTRQGELKTLLTGRKLTKLRDSHRLVSTRYRQSSVELSYVLRAMMFFEEAGGRRYTRGPGNGYQGFVDLTHLLGTNRAILVAQGPTDPSRQGHGAQLLCKDRNHQPIAPQQDQHVTVYRFVFEVKRGTPE